MEDNLIDFWSSPVQKQPISKVFDSRETTSCGRTSPLIRYHIGKKWNDCSRRVRHRCNPGEAFTGGHCKSLDSREIFIVPPTRQSNKRPRPHRGNQAPLEIPGGHISAHPAMARLVEAGLGLDALQRVRGRGGV